MSESFDKKSLLYLKPLLIILTIMFALGCTKAGSDIVGAWDNVKAPETVEFKADGSGVFKYSNNQNPPLAFSWKQAATNSYILDVNFMGTRKNLTASISGQQLSIESSQGRELYQKHTSH